MPRLLTLPRFGSVVRPGTDRDLVRRYAASADPEAFAELVRRHGPTVLAVCRRAARDPDLADDAFQATFLVLARRAGSLRDPGAVGSWLFGVARRTATAARRREARAQAGRPAPPSLLSGGTGLPACAAEWSDLLAVLDDELARLPDKLRAPLLCCYLDGRTQDEAARVLGVGLNTVRRRLERGRELLRVRMTARGATLGAGLFGGALAPAVAVPPALARAAVDHAAGGAAPARVLALAASGVPAVKWAAVVLVAVGGLAVGFGGARPADDPPKADPPKPAAARPDTPDPLPKGAVARMGSPRLRHTGGMQTLAFGLGGKVLISAHYPVACVWDARTGKLLRELGSRSEEADTDAVGGVGLVADGKRLVVTAERRIDRRTSTSRSFVWDLENDSEVRTFPIVQPKGRGAFSNPTVFAADGSRMAEASAHEPAVYLFDGDGRPAGRLDQAFVENRRTWPWDPVAFAPDGNHLYVAHPDRGVVVWDAAERKRVRSVRAGEAVTHAVAVSADGRDLATFDAAAPPKEGQWQRVPAAVRVWDPATGKPVTEFAWGGADPESDHTLSVGFLPDGSLWAAAASYTALAFRQWDRGTGRAVRDWSAPTPGTRSRTVAVSPDGSRVAAGADNGIVRLYDAATGMDITPGGGHRDEITDLRFTPDGKQLVTVSGDRTARTWDAATGKELRTVPGLDQYPRLSDDAVVVYAAKYTPSAPGKEEYTVVARDAATGKERWRLADTLVVAPSPDGKTVWRPAGVKGLEVIDAATGKAVRAVPIPGYPSALGDGGRMVVNVDPDGKAVSGWDAATGQKRFSWDPKGAGLLRSGPIPMQQNLEYADSIDAVAASPDGKHLALVVGRHLVIEDDQSSLYLCEAATGKVVWRAKSGTHFGRSVAFSPDGKSVAVAGWKARVYDAATGEERAVLDGHRSSVAVVAFSAAGGRLATGGADGTAVVWEVPRK